MRHSKNFLGLACSFTIAIIFSILLTLLAESLKPGSEKFSVAFTSELFFSFFTAYAARALVEKNFIVFSGAVVFFVGSFSYCFYLFNRYLREGKEA